MEELIPSEFYLSQNSPNPFRNSTNIKYCLPFKTNVYLTIFNFDGIMVKELVNQVQEAGTYEIKFDSHDFPYGEYYFQLQAGDNIKKTKLYFNKMKKMILIK